MSAPAPCRLPPSLRSHALAALLLAGLVPGDAWARGAPADFEPARLESGPVELPMPPAAGPGEVQLELTVSAGGAVGAVEPLRETPPYAEPLRGAVASWRFAPAREGGRAVESRVLVAAIIRPPSLLLPGGAGAPTKEVARASAAVPAPIEAVPPPYPPTARGSGLVLVEVDVSADGQVIRERIVRSAAGFDDAARRAARAWRFRPAENGGRRVPAVAYLLFGFREPVTPPVPRP